MSVTQISGLVSGLDTKSLIDALVNARSRPIALIQQRQAQKTSELTAWKSFEAVLVSLKISSDRLADAALWTQQAATTSDPDHLLVSASSKATTGSWDLFVEQLAVSHQVDSQAYASRDSLVGSGTLVFETATGTRDIDVAAGTSVSDLAAQVNAADIGVQATVVRSSAAGVESFRLVLTSAESGEANRFTVDAAGLSGGTAPVFTQSRLGEDAILRFGGENGTELHSSTNLFEDVMDGVDITVQKAHLTGESTSLTVERDTAAVESAIGSFVDSYNAMISFANGQFTFDAATGARPPLLGNSSLSSMVADLRSRVLGPVAGTENARFRTLLAAGIRSNGDGTVTFNESDFQTAVDTDFDSLADLFRVNAKSGMDGVSWVSSPASLALGARHVHLDITQAATRASLSGASLDLTAGVTIDSSNDAFRISIDGTRSEVLHLTHGTYTDGDALAAALEKAIVDSDSLGALSTGVSFEPDGAGTGHLTFTSSRWGSKGSLTLVTSGGNFAASLALTSVMNVNAQGTDVAGTVDGVAATGDGQRLTVPDDGSDLAGTIFQVTLEDVGTSTGVDVAFTEGIGRLTTRRLDSITDPATGELRRLSDSIQSILDRYTKDIEAKQVSLDARRARLEAQYAQLESTLSTLQGQGNFVTAQLSSLSAAKTK